MNKFVLSALALTTTGGLAVAGTGSEEWLTLDREIEALASTLAPQNQAGVTVSGFIRSSYLNSGDIVVGANDLGGFNMDNIRLSVEGSVGDFSVFVSADGSSSLVPGTGTTNVPFSVLLLGGTPLGGGGAFGVLDAYAAWNINEMLRLTMGQFLVPVIGNGLINENHLLFLNHTVSGTIFNSRDTGVMLSGQYDMFGFWVSVVNGTDFAGDELAYALRAEFYAMGGGVGSTVEGAYGSSQGNRLTVGAGYYNDDGNIPDGIAFGVDASFVSGPLSAAAEVVDYDSGFGDFTPLSAQAGFMFVPDQWEAAVRYQDLDTATDTSIITLGLNYYMSGHDAKWQLNYETMDDDVFDLDWFGIGLTASV